MVDLNAHTVSVHLAEDERQLDPSFTLNYWGIVVHDAAKEKPGSIIQLSGGGDDLQWWLNGSSSGMSAECPCAAWLVPRAENAAESSLVTSTRTVKIGEMVWEVPVLKARQGIKVQPGGVLNLTRDEWSCP